MDHFEQGLSKSQYLELVYEGRLQKADLVRKDENARRLRLQILLLEDENDELKEQLALEDNRIEELEKQKDALVALLEQTEAHARQAENDCRLRTRELSSMKVELSSMHNLSTDSAKHLTEKLSLAGELANLKPELEHLRAQASSQQNLLSEKLALQRQVNTLEVELEGEKRARASNRTAANEESKEKDIKLQEQLIELRNQLSKEKRERERLQNAADKASNEWEATKTVLESKLDQFRTKLRATKEQLKESQAELDRARMAKPESKADRGVAGNPRKRIAMDMELDAAIGTPDGVAARRRRPGVGRGKRDQTMLGEKSMFSITPFLNRTIRGSPDVLPHDSGADRSPIPAAQRPTQPTSEDEEDPNLASNGGRKESEAPSPKQKAEHIKTNSTAVQSEGTALTLAKPGKSNPKISIERPQHKSRTLDMVVEEEGDENKQPLPPISKTSEQPLKSIKLLAPSTLETEPKKKKRKLLGAVKTLFDEEEGEGVKRPSKQNVGPPRISRKISVAAPKTGFASGNANKGFGDFSPLKKDRRGAQASFLV